ncbi:MAG: histidine phosphatase family protein [Ekhidna sp.]|nr:histidine phosphatase family protein [Ekhidna sp.]
MRSLSFLFFVCLSTISFSQDLTTFILVRHSEKAKDGTQNPPLNEAGTIRSSNLAEMLSNQPVAALYATPFKRTIETLQPIAEIQDLEVQSYEPHATEEWLKSLIQKHMGGTVVIAGHSNTIPGLANSLIGSEVFTQFDDSDYSNLIVIVTSTIGQGKLIRLKF